MRTAALVGSVAFNGGHFQAQYPDFVIAVDSGWRHLRGLSVMPELVVGDFDSLGYVPQGVPVERHPSIKDESDMELACRTAVERGAGELLLYGSLGQRLDHTLANIQLMLGWARRGVRCWAIGEDFAITVLQGASTLDSISFEAIPQTAFAQGLYENYLSVFAFGGPARGVFEQGLKYCLDNAVVPDDASLGLSNEFIGRASSIRVGEGSLVVTLPLAAWDYRK